MNKLKQKWGITSNWQLFIILVVFSVNGTLAVKLAQPLTHFIGVDRETASPWLYWPIRVMLIFPIYQFLLVIVGTIFGQHQFFWNMEKKMLKRIGFKRFFKEEEEEEENLKT
ncbi:MAG: diacylglyceryl transferase [Flavobacteriaceae bacterium]|nr:diacylglyceryl transferase [Flavobacteriaceae bacterium]